MLFKNTKNQDKLFHALVDNKDTIYVLYDPKDEKVIYITKNIKDVLGLDIDYQKEADKTVKEILNIPINMFEFEDNTYVLAFCKLRGSIRHFTLSKILNIKEI